MLQNCHYITISLVPQGVQAAKAQPIASKMKIEASYF